MSITALGSLGTATVKATGTPVFISPSRDVPAGRFVAVWVAYDSQFDIFFPTHGENFYYCIDNAGNIWSNVGACTDRQAFASTGAASLLFVSQLRVDLTTSHTIQIGDGYSPLAAKAVSVEEFDLGDGMRWALNRVGWVFSAKETRTADPVSDTIDLEFSQEWLVLHCLANEGPPTDSFTWDAAWTQITAAGTTGGAADSNVTVLGGYRIATTSSETIDVANTTAARDNCQVMAGICAIKETTFPTTPLLDNFNRAAETPLSGGGNWEIGRTAEGSANLHLASNTVHGGGGSFWNEEWVGCQETYATITNTSSFAAIHITAYGDASIADLHGVGACTEPSLGAVVLGISGLQSLVDHGHVLAWVVTLPAGMKFGLKRTLIRAGSKTGATRLWIDIGDGWEELAAIFISGRMPREYYGQAAIAMRDSGPSMDDFGGGQIPCPNPFRPQIFRRSEAR